MVVTILGTSNGVHEFDGQEVRDLGLESERIASVYAYSENGSPSRILAGSYESGLFLSDDHGRTWQEITQGISALCIRWIGDDPLNPGSILAGTEPGRIFRSSDRGSKWTELDAIRDIEWHQEWFLPYSPRAGAVRNVYSPPGNHRLLASVEVGGLLVSDDNGASWECRRVGVDTDIHFITGHPEKRNILFAALGYAGIERTPNPEGEKHRGGLARSTDCGETWTKLFGDYTRAVIVPPSKPDIVIAGPAPDVGKNGRIEVSRDGGDTWEDASDGIETPMEDMVEVFVPAPDGSIWAICSGGRLLRAEPDELRWSPVLPESNRLKVESVSFAV